MKLALTTNARLYKAPDNHYYTQVVYNYNFFQRYLNVFPIVKLIAHTEYVEQDTVIGMVQVDGPGLEIYEVPLPHGKIEYIKKYFVIKKALKQALNECDAAILRIPDELAFQLYNEIARAKIPLAVEVTSDPWVLYKKGNARNSIFRPFIRIHWHLMQKKICKMANGTSYVTQHYLQQRYPYSTGEKHFTTFYTNADIDEEWLRAKSSRNINKRIRLVHVSTNVSNNAKGYREYLTAAGELIKEGIELDIVVVGNGDFNDECKNIVNKYGLEPYIIKTGKLVKKELLKELLKDDIFVFPSYVEGLPRVVVEAMATGLPCIATDLPGIVELIGNDWTVPVYDIKNLIEKIKQLIFDNELRIKVGINNRNIAYRYSKRIIEEKRTLFYRSLLYLTNKF